MRAPTLPGLADEHCNSLLPQHDPATRELVAIVGQWQVRQFAATDPRMLYGKTHGLLHIQLCHPHLQVSILTPSRLTGGKFEFCSDEQRFAVATWMQLRARCERDLALIELPSVIEIASLQHWLVSPHEDGAMTLLRAWWQGSPLKSWLRDKPAKTSPTETICGAVVRQLPTSAGVVHDVS